MELEALATVARFITQPLSLVALVALCVHAVEAAAMDLFFIAGVEHDRALSVRALVGVDEAISTCES